MAVGSIKVHKNSTDRAAIACCTIRAFPSFLKTRTRSSALPARLSNGVDKRNDLRQHRAFRRAGRSIVSHDVEVMARRAHAVYQSMAPRGTRRVRDCAGSGRHGNPSDLESARADDAPQFRRARICVQPGDRDHVPGWRRCHANPHARGGWRVGKRSGPSRLRVYRLHLYHHVSDLRGARPGPSVDMGADTDGDGLLPGAVRPSRAGLGYRTGLCRNGRLAFALGNLSTAERGPERDDFDTAIRERLESWLA